jgi:HSP20 family protein
MSKLILRRYDPLIEMSRMLDSMRGLVDRSLTTDGDYDEPSYALALDVRENDTEIIVQAALPGVSEDQIDVSVHEDVLTITAERKEEKEDEGQGWHMRELRYGKFSRSVRLPTEVNREKIEAGLSQGILTVRLPKAQPTPAHKIKVTARNLLSGGSKK